MGRDTATRVVEGDSQTGRIVDGPVVVVALVVVIVVDDTVLPDVVVVVVEADDPTSQLSLLVELLTRPPVSRIPVQVKVVWPKLMKTPTQV